MGLLRPPSRRLVRGALITKDQPKALQVLSQPGVRTDREMCTALTLHCFDPLLEEVFVQKHSWQTSFVVQQTVI